MLLFNTIWRSSLNIQFGRGLGYNKVYVHLPWFSFKFIYGVTDMQREYPVKMNVDDEIDKIIGNVTRFVR